MLSLKEEGYTRLMGPSGPLRIEEVMQRAETGDYPAGVCLLIDRVRVPEVREGQEWDDLREELAESYGASALGVSTLDETLSNVLNGRADATLNADVSFYDYMSVHPDDPLMIVDLTEDAHMVQVELPDGSFEEAVNQAIDELRADGTLAQLSVTYFGEDITSEADAEEAQTE